jgi:hypothetical protein
VNLEENPFSLRNNPFQHLYIQTDSSTPVRGNKGTECPAPQAIRDQAIRDQAIRDQTGLALCVMQDQTEATLMIRTVFHEYGRNIPTRRPVTR